MNSLTRQVSSEPAERKSAFQTHALARRNQPIEFFPDSGVLQRQPACACGGGCPRCQAAVSTLKIGAPDDAYEREADQVAEQVMSMPASEALVQSRANPQLQRKCEACEEDGEDDGEILRKAESPQTGIGLPSAPPLVREVLDSPGQPLDEEARAFFEPRFGRDFSQVRVHANEKAAESSRAIGALAYTVGPHVSFAAGQFEPSSAAGRRLIAHELAHVVQQQAGHGLQSVQRSDDQKPPVTVIEIPPQPAPFNVDPNPPRPPEAYPPMQCQGIIRPMECSELENLGGPQVKTVEIDGIEDTLYNFSCTEEACMFTNTTPWIIVPQKSFACGDLVNICAFGYRSQATVVDRRPDLRWNEFIVSNDISVELGSPGAPFAGKVYEDGDEQPSDYACCPEGAARIGQEPGDYPTPPADEQVA